MYHNESNITIRIGLYSTFEPKQFETKTKKTRRLENRRGEKKIKTVYFDSL